MGSSLSTSPSSILLNCEKLAEDGVVEVTLNSIEEGEEVQLQIYPCESQDGNCGC